MSYCDGASSVNRGLRAVRIVTLRCRSWGCDLCHPRRKAQLIALAHSGHATTFITLSVRGVPGTDPVPRARALADALPKLMKAACKKYGYKHIPYLCVFEATKKGEAHLHILCRVRWIDQAWMSNFMRDLIDAPVVDIRFVKDKKRMAFYIAKYIGKAAQRFGTCKRYWRTRDWELIKYVPDPIEGDWSETWDYYQWSQDVMQGYYEALGFTFDEPGAMAVGRQQKPPWKRFEDASL